MDDLADLARHSEIQGLRLLGHSDLSGRGDGMQILVQEREGTKYAFVSHMGDFRVAFSVLDVTDPRRPAVVAQVPTPTPETHAHKLQVWGEVLLSNNEAYGAGARAFAAGVRLFDVANPKAPREIGFFETGGTGVHRMWFHDGRYAHLSAGAPGYRTPIYRVLDLADPARPREAMRWWLPEQEGEGPPEPIDRRVWCHYPIGIGTRAYVSYWQAGVFLLDITGFSPRVLGRFNPTPPYGGAAHTFLPLARRQLAIVTQEALADRLQEGQKAVWVLDLRAETNPVPIATFPVPRAVDPRRGGRFGPHNVHENPPGSYQSEEVVFLTYFNAGLRVVDVSDPYAPAEIGWFVPPPPPGSPKGAPQINDVYVDRDGLVYCTDRYTGGLYILELTAAPLRRSDPRDLWAR